MTQVWFAGAHADVGGGYPDAELSDISLAWMIAQLKARGLRFVDRPLPLKNPFDPHHTPWKSAPFDAVPPVERKVVATAKFHASVQARLAGYAQYLPVNLATWLKGGRQLPPDVLSS